MQSDLRTILLQILRSRELTQDDLAKEIGVSQSTLCRALERPYARKSRSRTKIEKYLEKTAYKLHKLGAEPEIYLAIQKVWDKTPRHARILVGIIESLVELTPKTETKGESRQYD